MPAATNGWINNLPSQNKHVRPERGRGGWGEGGGNPCNLLCEGGARGGEEMSEVIPLETISVGVCGDEDVGVSSDVVGSAKGTPMGVGNTGPGPG